MKQMLVTFILKYFRFLAKIQLRKNPRAIVIGVTGSAGKTSTRQAITLILRSRGQVKSSVGANSESGIPLNILGLRPINYSFLDWLRLALLAPLQLLTNWEHFDYYVVEMGIDSPSSPKNMAYLLSIIRPHIGVVLNAGLTHTANFDHLVKDRDPERRDSKLRRLVAREKMQLAAGITPHGVAVINLDSPDLLHYIRGVKTRILTFGQSTSADLRIVRSKVGAYGFRLTLSYQSHSYDLALPDLLPLHFSYTFAAAVAVAAGLSIPPRESCLALGDYRAPAGRLRVFPGMKHTTIIDSSYNASPDTMREALTFFHRLSRGHRRIAVIGDMRELGDSAKHVHKLLADWVSESVDEVFLFGPLTGEHTYPVLVSRVFPAHHFDSMSELVKYLHSHLQAESWVLVKGSQNGILLERAVEAILKNPDDAKSLCRRGSYWDKIRAKTP
jgi:UDP-N-acetylmuramoyl-tripeptide--D-alanyl-D-alanine ligase